MNGGQSAKDTTHTRHHSLGVHRLTGAKLPRTPQTHHNTVAVHTGEKEPSGQRHHMRNTTHGGGTSVIRCQVAKDTAHTAHQACRSPHRDQVAKDTTHAIQHTERTHR